MTGLNVRRAAALKALAHRPARQATRFPGETQPSGDIPEDPDLAAQHLAARDNPTTKES